MFVNPARRIPFGRAISTQFDPKVDLYKVLEATDKMSQKEIKKQYYKLAHKYHPDKAGDSAAEKFKQISGAWEVIGDPDQRKQYDLSRIAQPSSSGPGYNHKEQAESQDNFYGDFASKEDFYKFYSDFKGKTKEEQESFKSKFNSKSDFYGT